MYGSNTYHPKPITFPRLAISFKLDIKKTFFHHPRTWQGNSQFPVTTWGCPEVSVTLAASSLEMLASITSHDTSSK